MRTTHRIMKSGAARKLDSVGTVYRADDDATVNAKENKVDGD